MKKLIAFVVVLALAGVLAADTFARGGRGGGGRGRGGMGRSGRAGAAAALRRARNQKDDKANQERTRTDDEDSLLRRAARHRRCAG
jgi:hypothetical protein